MPGSTTVDEVRLAGAFGSQIDPFHAMVLGLIPDAPLDRVKAAGNAAGTGRADRPAVSAAARREIEGVVRRVEKIETAVEPRFQEHFVEAMAFPHRTAPSTAPVARSSTLPARDRRRRPAGGRPRAATAAGAATTARSCGRREGGPMTDRRAAPPADRRPRRPAGAPALSAHVAREPFLTRTLAPFEVLNEEGLVDSSSTTPTRSSRRSASSSAATRTRSRLLRDAGADVQGERVRFPRGMCRQIVQATAPRAVHPVRPQPRANNVQIGGSAHRPRPELRLAVRARPRQRPALRHDRGLPQLREARLHDARTSTTAAGRSASRSTCRSTSATSTWSIRTSATATSRSWARSPHPERARDTVEMARIAFGARLPRGPHR